MADLLLVSCPSGNRAAWLELWELTQARGRLLRDAEIALKVHRDLWEALTWVQV